jgi:methionyl-tRNA synthetase
MYVWLDALTNYITAAGYPDIESETFKTFWPADLHMVGKDILRFHAVYWPAFLMSAGIAPPKRVFAHGWWTNEGQKISKSLGNVIDPHLLIERYGLDQVRYFLLREVPFGSDGDFSHRSMVGRSNNDLANDFGNLSQRVLSMIHKNCEAKVPEPGAFTAADEALLAQARGLHERLRKEFAAQQFHRGLEAVWEVISAANRYVDEQAPWALRKTDPARMASVLHTLCETIRRLALLTQAFMPEASGKMLDQLAVAAGDRDLAAIGDTHRLKPGTALPKPAPIFPRFVEAEEGAA